MWKCKNCGSEIENDYLLSCWNCGFGKDGSPPEHEGLLEKPKRKTDAPRSSTSIYYSSSRYTSGYVSALNYFGWAFLIMGIIGGLIALSYIVAAVAIMIQGIFLFVLCNVVAEIAEGVRAIENKSSDRR